MSFNDGAWKTLVEKYAGTRSLCNCRLAYQDTCGKWGCSAAERDAVCEVTTRLMQELETKEGTDGSLPKDS